MRYLVLGTYGGLEAVSNAKPSHFPNDGEARRSTTAARTMIVVSHCVTAANGSRGHSPVRVVSFLRDFRGACRRCVPGPVVSVCRGPWPTSFFAEAAVLEVQTLRYVVVGRFLADEAALYRPDLHHPG